MADVREYAPKLGWTLVGETTTSQWSTLQYEKGPQKLSAELRSPRVVVLTHERPATLLESLGARARWYLRL
jgi:hypothetical protein